MGVYGTFTPELSDDDRWPVGTPGKLYLTTSATPDVVQVAEATVPPPVTDEVASAPDAS